MNSVPPVLPAGQQKNRNMAVIILIATLLTIFMAIVFLRPTLFATDSAFTIFQSADVQSAEKLSAAALPYEVPSLLINPELRIVERFRAKTASVTAERMLYDNPELLILDYDRPFVVNDLYANPELKTLDYAEKSIAVDLYANPELKALDYSGRTP